MYINSRNCHSVDCIILVQGETEHIELRLQISCMPLLSMRFTFRN